MRGAVHNLWGFGGGELLGDRRDHGAGGKDREGRPGAGKSRSVFDISGHPSTWPKNACGLRNQKFPLIALKRKRRQAPWYLVPRGQRRLWWDPLSGEAFGKAH